jgi:branched-subunit amino acid transport protein
VSAWEVIIASIGLAVITLMTRSFFFISDGELRMPDRIKRGLKYAPLAALAAVIVPELVMTRGELITTLLDARWPAAAVATAYFFWRRGILGTILVGMAVYLPLHVGLGW